ncbi:MAG: hypothetical protein A2066_03795 [Bacteroidetes bacterium GWB2_41_8]|nr:MAG: hypothetical protein A2066_03795 [Bacteroidetes bacterium GWB2_41_8]
MWKRFKLTLKRVSTYEYKPRYSRLAGDIASFEPRLHKRIFDTGSAQKQWALKSLELLKQTKEFLDDYKIDEGWKSFHTAKRFEIYGMDRHERLALAKAIYKESDKLNDWRKASIVSMLGNKAGEVTDAPEPDVLILAAELKDEDYNNMYYMNRLSHNIFWLLSGLLFLTLCLIVLYFVICSGWYDIKFTSTDLNLTGYIIGVLLFGFLGALTSAILFTRNLSKSSRIKEITSSQVVVMSKIFIGVGFSIFIFLLLRSSVAEGIKLFSFSISQPLDYFAIAFASGFTEKFAQKSMDLLIGKDKTEKSKTSESGII